MPAHIEGVMPNPHEALTEADRLRRTSAKSLTAAREDALPQITAHTQPYMLTILPQEGQCGIPARKRLEVG